jgi:hypothetical protein
LSSWIQKLQLQLRILFAAAAARPLLTVHRLPAVQLLPLLGHPLLLL